MYIGEAGLGTSSNLFKRLKQHRKGMMAGRWDRFSWFGRETCTGQASIENALKQLEAVTIAIINPVFNKQSGAFAAKEPLNKAGITNQRALAPLSPQDF